MKSIIKIIILILPAVILCNCSNKKEAKTNYNIGDINLKIIDSFSINSKPLIFQDYKNGKLLFYNYVSTDIVTFNINNRNENIFNKNGDAFDQYKNISPIAGVRYINDSIVGVGEINGIKMYTKDGEYKGNIPVDNKNTLASLKNFTIFNDTLLVTLLSPQGDPTLKSFYNSNHKLFLKKNLNNNISELIGNTANLFGNFPERESDLSNSEFYFNYIYDYFDSKYLNNYSIINSNDTKIFTYDVYSGDLINIKELILDHYNPLKFRFGKKYNSDKTFINMFANSRITGYYKYGDYEYVTYIEGLKEREVIEFAKTHKNFPQHDRPESNYWMQTLINGKKTGQDIKLNNKLGYILMPLSENKYLVKKSDNEEDEVNNKNYYYVVEIQ